MANVTVNVTVKWICPHCGFENITGVEVESSYLGVPLEIHKIAVCDIDGGGCERASVVTTTLTATIRTQKIEGA